MNSYRNIIDPIQHSESCVQTQAEYRKLWRIFFT